MERARPQLERATVLNRRMQQFLRDWDRADRTPAPAGFIDQSKVQVVRRLNGRPPAPLGGDEFLQKLRLNLDLMERLAAEIVTRASLANPAVATAGWSLPAPSEHLGDLFSRLGMPAALPEVVTSALAS
jgi:hypothetical protein